MAAEAIRYGPSALPILAIIPVPAPGRRRAGPGDGVPGAGRKLPGRRRRCRYGARDYRVGAPLSRRETPLLLAQGEEGEVG